MYKRIIEIIVDLSKNNFTLDELSKKYNVSKQTIRNDIDVINDILDECHFEKIIIKAGHILRPDNFTEIKRYINTKIEATNLYSYHLSKEESIILITVILIFRDKYVTIEQLSDALLIGRTTLFNRLHAIRQYIDSLGLTMYSSSNKGIILKNTELEKRKALVELICQTVRDNEFLLNLILKLNLVTKHDYRRIIKNILHNIQHEFQISFSDNTLLALNYYLNFMIERIEDLNCLENSIPAHDSSLEYAKRILSAISSQCNIPVMDNEINFLSSVLDSTITYSSSSRNIQQAMPIQLLTSELISRVSDALQINLNQDFELYENLSSHLISIYKNSIVNEEDNPVLDDVRSSQPDLVNIVEANIQPVEIYFQRKLNETEIIYIVVHFSTALERNRYENYIYNVIIACNAGIGISQLLKTKLSYIKNIHVVRTIDSHDIANLSTEDADLLISAVPIYQCPIEFVNISSRLTNDDLLKITNKIKKMYEAGITPVKPGIEIANADEIAEAIRPVIYEVVEKDPDSAFHRIRQTIYDTVNRTVVNTADTNSPRLYELLSPKFIQLDLPCTDWQDVIRKVCLPLLNQQYFNSDYINEIIKVTEEYGPYYILAPEVALPHASPGKNSYKTGISFARLSEPVDFGTDQKAPVRYVFVLSVVDKQSHLRSLFTLIQLIRSSRFIEQLSKAKNPDQVHRVIYHFETELPDGTVLSD